VAERVSDSNTLAKTNGDKCLLCRENVVFMLKPNVQS
jgi:hypothetical protein